MHKNEGSSSDLGTQHDENIVMDNKDGGAPNTAPVIFLSGKVKCLSFGIKDYLNNVRKEVEQETWCGDYGLVLTTVPPTAISDSESSIEPLPVSLSLPLHYTSSDSRVSSGGDVTTARKSTLRLLRWKSCQDFSPHRRPCRLRRQLTEQSFKGRFSAGLVEVYDGNLGISVVPMSVNTCRLITMSLCCDGDSKNVCTEIEVLKGPASSPPSLESHSVSDARPTRPRGFSNDTTVVGSNEERDGSSVKPSVPSVDDAEAMSHASEDNPRKIQHSQNDSLGKAGHVVDMDDALGIQEDDGTGPGLSEDEQQEEWLVGGGEGSGDKPSWTPTLQCSLHSVSEMSVRRFHPVLPDTKKIPSKGVTIVQSDHCHQNSSDKTCGPRQRSSASHKASSHVLSPSSRGNSCSSMEEDSDAAGAELSELERWVLNLSQRRSRFKKQDTNACIIAPPEFKIAETLSHYQRGPHEIPP